MRSKRLTVGLLLCLAGFLALDSAKGGGGGKPQQRNTGLASALQDRASVPAGRLAEGQGGLASRLSRAGQPDDRAQLRERFTNRGLSFEPNQGQTDQRVTFISRGKNYTIFLTPDELVLRLRSASTCASEKDLNSRALSGSASETVFRAALVGANPNPHIAGLEELPGKANYFIGRDPRNWKTEIPTYAKVRYEQVYPGVDLVFYGNQRQLEHDFVVAPGADPRAIRLAFDGARRLRIDSHGDLVIQVASGELRLQKPLAYQEMAGLRQPVAASFVRKGKHDVALRLGMYDPTRAVVIDPVLAYSSYLGGSNIDYANGIAVAPDGTAFVAGGTFSLDFPTAGTHPLQPNAGGPNDFPKDAFVAKLSADGSTLLYSTYLGGARQDVASAIAVDAAGEAFVTGTTFSGDFPVTAGSFNTLCGGDGQCGATWNTQGFIVSNAFVTKLNTAGSGLVYSGFLGYYENVQGLGIAVDGGLNAYVTGATGPNIAETVPLVPPATPPPPFPIVGGFQTTFVGNDTDTFITKISASGTGILYSSYLGGGEDVGHSVAVDRSANAYVTGLTSSIDFPVTAATALQTTYAGAGDAYLSIVNTTAAGAASLVYSTYLGGTGIDQGNGVAVDASGNAYVTGATTSVASSLGFTPPAGAFQTNCALDTLTVCEGDAFVAKFNPALSGAASLLYFTYLGGSFADSGAGIAVDASGNVYVTGSTVSTSFPIQGAVFQPHFGGGNADAFVTELNPAGAALVYSTFLGGTNADNGTGIAVDVNGGAYIAGQTCSLDFPLANPWLGTPGGATPGGNCDAFVSKLVPSGGVVLSPAGLIFPIQAFNTASAPQTVTLTNGGSTALTLSSIALTGANTLDFSQINTCGSSVPALGECTITVTFTPIAVGTRTAQITITDDSPAPGSTQVVNLTGTGGTLPTVSLSASTLAFGNQAINVTSAPQYLTVTNTGTATLNLTSVIASGDFAVKTNGCTAPLQATTPPSNCTISVTFTPTLPGSSVGSLTLTDNAANSPQQVTLTGVGTGGDFQMTASPPGATVIAGGSANFAISVIPDFGFNARVDLGCSGSTSTVTCSISPASVTPDGTNPASVSVVVRTTARAMTPPGPGGNPKLPGLGGFNWTWFAWLLGLTMLPLLLAKHRRAWLLAAGLGALLLLASCAGGSVVGVPRGTPPGTYNLTISGTSGSLTHSTTVSLTVN